MTQFEITPKLKETIGSSSLNSNEKTKLLSDPYISHKELVKFYQTCRPTPSLLHLIQQSKLHTPPFETYKQPKTKEFLKSMEKLRLEAKELEYRRLINPTPQFSTLYDEKLNEHDPTPQQAAKEVKNQLTTIVNIIISVVSVAYAIWYWTETSWGLPVSYRVLLSVFFGLLVLVAEVVVYMGYINKIEEARTRERKKKEVKKVVRTYNLKQD
ncbi:Vacuolar ATPase assembly integral membrane protein VPH2 [Candida viswanathii]|uniref:Vacuolar ATPase assembly integral membrane protein VPH2 n=1 Tax=Candida viswanathii TaxID=5486 RepID=A0A367YF41_9ASCO|nr:Vacuolar ATPase assembly integral membrane protein VPH2 [Candida viswanathii]